MAIRYRAKTKAKNFVIYDEWKDKYTERSKKAEETAIVLRYSAHIKPRKTIKTIKTENITHKHNMTLVVSS